MATMTASNFVRAAPGGTVVDVAGLEDFNQSLAVQGDGKILVAGFSLHNGAYDYSVVRLNANGTLDPRFGDNGRAVVLAQAPVEDGYSLAVQADGSLLVASPNDSGAGYGLIRMNAQGALDQAFNANAQASLLAQTGGGDSALSVAADGSVLLTTVGAGGRVTLVQLKADGTVDPHFGHDGYLAFDSPVAFGTDAQQVRLLPDGHLLVAFNQYTGGYPYTLMQLSADGALDPGFGEGGLVVFNPAIASYADGGVTVQPDGKILLASNPYTYDQINVIRLNADGSYDSTFGTDGIASMAPQGNAGSAHSITVQPDGRIVVAGDTDGDFSVLRLGHDGDLDKGFGSPDGKHYLTGSAGDDSLPGLDSAEVIRGLAGADALQGNAGRDLLAGGEGADVFRFQAVSDSYRTDTRSASDHILDFAPGEDRIDLSALGFTGIGNGQGTTVAVKVNAEGTYTYLKNYAADDNGHRFEVAIEGDFSNDLDTGTLVFAPTPVHMSGDTDAVHAVVEPLTYLGVDTTGAPAGSDGQPLAAYDYGIL